MSAEARTWVVDASVAFAWFVAVPNAEQAALLLAAAPGTLLLAPDLVLVELLNAAWKSRRLGAITSEQFQMLASRASEPFKPPVPRLGAVGLGRSLVPGTGSPCLRLPVCGPGRTGTGHLDRGESTAVAQTQRAGLGPAGGGRSGRLVRLSLGLSLGPTGSASAPP